MERINTTNKEVDLFGAGKHGFRDGNPGGGIFATFLSAAWFNTLQEEVANIIEAFGDALNPADKTQLRKAVFQSPSMLVGCDCKNNAVTPNTQFDVLARQVSMRNPANGSLITLRSPAVRTINILTAGPAINARDQAGALSNSSWVHFYWIGKSDGSYNAIASSADESTGPTLPTGYTHWAYAGACYMDSAGALRKTQFKGARAFYEIAIAALSAGAATAESTVNVSALVPPNAISYALVDKGSAALADGAGTVICLARIRVVSGSDYWTPFNIVLTGLGASATSRGSGGACCELPNMSQQFLYQWAVTNGSAPSLSLDVVGYKMPNGGE